MPVCRSRALIVGRCERYAAKGFKPKHACNVASLSSGLAPLLVAESAPMPCGVNCVTWAHRMLTEDFSGYAVELN